MQISGIAAITTYIVDGVFKLREYRRKSRAERLAASDGETKTEEPYVDEEKLAESPATAETATVNTD